jgi:periplasmic copper chaperone A
VKRNVVFALAIAILLSACGAEKGIEVHQVWMRPVARGENGAVYFAMHNHASEADELVGVSTDSAEAAELHESKMNGDVIEMNQVEAVSLEPYDEIEFAPGKYHIMLVNLKKDLSVGDEIQLTLHFKNFEDININVAVRDTPAPEEDHPSADN